MSLTNLDLVLFFSYCSLILVTGIYISYRKKNNAETSNDYFLASKSLSWWAIGASLIASNISAEQFIGMSGSGYAIGLGIASYEWMSAITLILVGKYLLPVFIKNKIYSMPHFLEIRFDNRVKTLMAFFWMLVYVFVNLTSVLYLGALALSTITGFSLTYSMLGLAAFAGVYSIYGGLKAVAWTDVIQVVFLLGGGIITTILALQYISDTNSAIDGMKMLLDKAPEKFNMIIEKGEVFIPDGAGGKRDAYLDLPGIGVIVGGMWIANISYWGFNQYIIQRGLAAKSIKEAQKGIVFAGFLKILIPIIVVLPGIAAFVISKDSGTIISPSDKAYPWLLHNIVPTGIKGLTIAALTAAIVSSLASMLNSTSTIFTLDIFDKVTTKKHSEKKLVSIGRISAVVFLLIAVFTAKPLLGNLDQAFQYIQEFTGYITPGIVAIFLLGIFWKKATASSAFYTAILTIPISFTFDLFASNIPFLNRMGIVFLLLTLVMVILSLVENSDKKIKTIIFNRNLFKTSCTFNSLSVIIVIIIAALYMIFW